MGIQINGQTDTISSTDGSLNIGGTVTVNVTGDATGLTGTPDITVGAVTASSATISGDLTVNGTTTTLDTTLTEVDKLEVGANNTTVGVAITQSGSGDILRLYDGATRVVTVKDGGSVGIGTDNPDQKLELFTATGTNLVKVATQANSTIGIELEKTGATTQSWRIADGQTVNGKLEFYDVTDTTTRMCLDGDGRLLVGNGNISSQSTFYTGRIQVQGTNSSNSAILIKTNQNDSGSPALVLAKSRGTTVGSNTIVQEGDEIGIILFNGSDGTDIASRTAHIASAVDGVVGVNSMPGRLQFSTTSRNSSTPTERMRIDSNGDINIDSGSFYFDAVNNRFGLGITSPGSPIHIATTPADASSPVAIRVGNDASGSGTGASISLGAGGGAASTAGNIAGFYDGTGTALSFSTSSSYGVSIYTERARIDSSGRLLVGLTTGNNRNLLQIQGDVDNGANGVGGISLRRGVALGSIGNGSQLGQLDFCMSDGGVAARIICDAEGSAGTGDYPGRLQFETTADGASSPTERAVIDSAGRTNLSTSSQAGSFVRDAKLRVINGGSARCNDFALMNTTFSDAATAHTCERANSSQYRFAEYYSSRRYDNSSGDQEFALRGDGNAYADGSWNGGGADYAEYFEWSDGNTSAEDRRGISVVLDGDKIRQAVAGEDPIGVISGNPSVVGDAAWNKWNGQYLCDDFGTYQRESYSLVCWQNENGETESYQSDSVPDGVTVPDDAVTKTVDDSGNTLTRRVLNPNYDPNVTYVPREQRAEWDAVGLMGKLRIRKGQVTGARWIKMRDISETVEEWLVR